jgi:hypothetical protein
MAYSVLYHGRKLSIISLSLRIAWVQPLQSRDLRPQTVILRKGLLGGVQVMLYDGQHYHLAKNNQELLARAQALVQDVGKGDYPAPWN